MTRREMAAKRHKRHKRVEIERVGFCPAYSRPRDFGCRYATLNDRVRIVHYCMDDPPNPPLKKGGSAR